MTIQITPDNRINIKGQKLPTSIKISKMWCKALIVVFAAVSAAIEADAKKDLATKVYKKLDEFRGLHNDAVNETYSATEETFRETNELIVDALEGLQRNFSYKSAGEAWFHLEAKAKKLGKDITVCFRIYNNLDLLQVQQIAKTIHALNQDYSESAGNIQTFVDRTLHSMDLKQQKKADKHGSEIKQCLLIKNELSQKSCLLEVLSKIEIDIIQSQSEATTLGLNTRYQLLEMHNDVGGALSALVDDWEQILQVVVDTLTTCAEYVFNDGNSTVDIEQN